MNINSKKCNQQAGSVLAISLIMAVLLGLVMGSYLYWVRSQHVLVTESQSWNAALAAAEAGIEEGMAQINVGFGNVASPTQYMGSAQANWTLSGGIYGPRINTNLLNASYSAVINPVPISPNSGPTITATGYAAVPYISRPIVRTVRVTTSTAPVFANAMSAILGVTTKGSGITVDSYDSTDPNHSTNGMYNAATRLAGGDIASIAGNISIQGGKVYGHIRTGPTGSYDIGNNSGSVGDLNWVPTPGVKPGWYENDFSMGVNDVAVPYTSGWSIPKNNDATNTYPLVTGNYYYSGDFKMAQNEVMNVSGNVTLYVTGDFIMQSQNACMINILPGGTLKLFVGGGKSGSQLTQVNTTGNAMTFQLFGLPGLTSLNWSGNSTYMGTVYAPEADFSCGGGGNNNYDYQGSCVVRSVSMNGHFNFHFDENLKRVGPIIGFQVTSWQEL